MLYRNRDFLKLWAGQSVSLFGSLLGAIPFAAIFVLDVTPFEMGLLGAAGLVPRFAAGLVAGAVVDRLRRRPVLVATDVGRALLLGSVFAAIVADVLTFPHLCGVAFLSGLLTIFFDVAYPAYLPSLVERDELVAANSRLAASSSVMETGSFTAGGWLVQLGSASLAVAIDAFSFLVSAACVLAIRRAEPAPTPRPAGSRLHTEAMEGMRALAADHVLLAGAVASAARHFSYGLVGSAILLFVFRDLDVEPGVAGIVFALGGVSSLGGAIVAGRAAARLGTGPATWVSLLVAGAGTILIPLAPNGGVAGLALLSGQQLLGDGADTVFDITVASTRQAQTAEQLRGRVEATVHFAALGAMLAGTLLGGVIGGAWGLRVPLFLGAASTFAGVAVLLASPARRRRPHADTG